jgi:hypothetical protein
MRESRMHAAVPVRFGRGRLDSLATKGLAAYLLIECCPGNISRVCTNQPFPRSFLQAYLAAA